METDKIVKIIIDELQNRGLIKEKQHSAYSNTELLLYNYENLRQSITENELEIKELQEFGLPCKSGSVISTEKIDGGLKENNLTLIEDRVNALRQTNARTVAFLNKIDRLIKIYNNPKYPDLIRNLYIKNKTYEQCAEIYSCDTKTISRQKHKVVNQIKIMLFADELTNIVGC